METRFILPATIATALHALALLVPREPAPPPIKTIADPPSRLFQVPLDPPDEVIEVTTSASKPTKGPTEIPRPTSDEPPAKVVPDGSFVEKIRVVTRAVFDLDRIPAIIPGAAEGDAAGWGDVKVLDGSLLDNEPHTRSQVSPLYPAELKRLGVAGEVLVEFIVDETGRVLSPRVVHSTDRGFDEATLRAVARWRFEPGKKDGRTVRFRMTVPVVFNLGS